MHQKEVRSLIADVERRLSELEGRAGAGGADDVRGVRDSWDALTKFLNVGPAPATRLCPSCKSEIMRDATLCMHCWTKSSVARAE